MKLTRAFLLIVCMVCPACAADQPATSPASKPIGKLPHIEVDAKNREVRVECEALNVDMPLEFFCVISGTNEHESVLRSPVKASDLHLALLMLGLEPGETVHYSEAAKKWIPPHGPPLHITVEYQKDGKTISDPAYRWMRSIKDQKEMPAMTWIFAGSKIMPDGVYAGDRTGYLVSVVNFDLSLIDIPDLASNANETLVWKMNPDRVPPAGTKVTMIIKPTGKVEKPGIVTTTSGVDSPHELAKLKSATTAPAGNLSNIAADQEMVKTLREKWQAAVAPHTDALKQAAQTHYEVITALRREQQRIIDEADKIQRLIDELEKDYQDMTTPRPETGK